MGSKEKWAIQDYTSDKFLQLNRKLITKTGLDKSDERLIKDLDSAIEKMPKRKGITYRNLQFDTDEKI